MLGQDMPDLSVDATAEADTATAHALHQAALEAIAAREAGDTAAYGAAVNRLYQLGVWNARTASVADLQVIADSANRESLFGSIAGLAKWGAIAIAAIVALPLVASVRRRG